MSFGLENLKFVGIILSVWLVADLFYEPTASDYARCIGD